MIGNLIDFIKITINLSNNILSISEKKNCAMCTNITLWNIPLWSIASCKYLRLKFKNIGTYKLINDTKNLKHAQSKVKGWRGYPKDFYLRTSMHYCFWIRYFYLG